MKSLKVITEQILRQEKLTLDIYTVPIGSILTPAAREYLNGLSIKISDEKLLSGTKPKGKVMKKYTEYNTGKTFSKKPEHMTQLHGNILIDKDSPRIILRGKLDSLQSLIVLTQSIIHEKNGPARIVDDLEEILGVIRTAMSCEILEKPFYVETIIGLTVDELREHSHYPEKYYGIKQMLLPNYKMGNDYAMLNSIRTLVRETEIYAVSSFKNDINRSDIITVFNRLSSTLHIMMCKYLAKQYI